MAFARYDTRRYRVKPRDANDNVASDLRMAA